MGLFITVTHIFSWRAHLTEKKGTASVWEQIQVLHRVYKAENSHSKPRLFSINQLLCLTRCNLSALTTWYVSVCRRGGVWSHTDSVLREKQGIWPPSSLCSYHISHLKIPQYFNNHVWAVHRTTWTPKTRCLVALNVSGSTFMFCIPELSFVEILSQKSE